MTTGEIMAELQRLLKVYPRPKQMPADPVELAKVYAGPLGSLDTNAVRSAVDKYMASDARFFPTPGQLATLADHRRAFGNRDATTGDYLNWERDWGRREDGTFSACPVCGAFPECGTHGRFRVHHLADVHEAKRLPLIGWSDRAEAFYHPVKPEQEAA